MKPQAVIEKGFLRNFLFILLMIFITGTALSALVLYLSVHKPLDTHYSAIISIATGIRESIVATSIKTGIVFLVLIAAGAGLLTLLYTHRIAGPLYRIRQCTKSISEGRLDTEIRLRRKDAVTAFADSVNGMTQFYREKVSALSEELKNLEHAVSELDPSRGAVKDTKELRDKIHTIDRKIKMMLEELKF